jgi:putative effector of murein hydrolase LrgA (UPF0299 family)
MILAQDSRHSAKPIAARLKAVFWLDAVLLVSVCALETVPVTGMVLHEWLGLAIAAMIVAHLLLSWAWVAAKTRQLFAVQPARTRINYFLNLLLFACMTAVVYSGILISQDAVPALTGKAAADLTGQFGWDLIHRRFSDWVLILAGLHLVINWEWSVAAARKILRKRED